MRSNRGNSTARAVCVMRFSHLRPTQYFFTALLFCLALSLFTPVQAQTYSGPVAETEITDLRTAHDTLLSDDSYVFDYAEFTPPEVEDPNVKNRDIEPFWEGLGGILSGIFKIGFVVILALIAFYILKSLYDVQIAHRRGAAPKPEAPPLPDYQPDKDTANVVLGDAARLAAQGRYSEAVHIILLSTIADIKAKRPRAVPRDLTSREISQLDILSETAKACFREISARVERSFFGGRELGEADYLASYEAYKRFAIPATNTATKVEG